MRGAVLTRVRSIFPRGNLFAIMRHSASCEMRSAFEGPTRLKHSMKGTSAVFC